MLPLAEPGFFSRRPPVLEEDLPAGATSVTFALIRILMMSTVAMPQRSIKATEKQATMTADMARSVPKMKPGKVVHGGAEQFDMLDSRVWFSSIVAAATAHTVCYARATQPGRVTTHDSDDAD